MNSPLQTNLRGFIFRTFRHHVGLMVVLVVLFQCTPIARAVDILEAAKGGDAVAVRSILQTNAAAALVANNLGQTALHLGVGAASPAVVEALLATKAPVHAQAQGYTALHYAILYRRIYPVLAGITNIQELIQFVVEDIEGILNPEIRTAAGRTPPVDMAALRRNFLERGQPDPAQIPEELKVVALLLAAGADPNAPDLLGMTPVHAAAFRPQPEFLKGLLEKGGNVLVSPDAASPSGLPAKS